MDSLWRYLRLVLLALTLLHLVTFGIGALSEISRADGLLVGAHQPLGGDFINLYAAARLVLGGHAADIYLPQAFVAYEQAIIPADIGVRLWAYPPQSLLFAWPFGMTGFLAALAIWSAFGLGVLLLGARRLGLGWVETAILTLSPAALQCLHDGQTGNLFCGLLLVALAKRGRTDGLSILSGALLTIKPQTGFLLPLLWLAERRWAQLLWTALAALGLVLASLLIFGPARWTDYLDRSLSLLNQLERHGSGPFMLMIPSVFMSGRVLGLGDGTAALVHGIVALGVAIVLVWRLLGIADPVRRAALLLLATALITPYLHNYDLGIVLAGALLLGRELARSRAPAGLAVGLLVILAWGLPNLVLTLNSLGLPASPLLLGALFLVAAFAPAAEVSRSSAASR